MTGFHHASRVLNIGEYQGALTNSVYPIRLDLPGSAASFEAKLRLARLGTMDLVLAGAASPFHCTQQAAPRGRSEPYLILKMQLEGGTSYRHIDKQLSCTAGDIALLSDTDIIVGEQHGAAQALVLKVPYTQVRSLAPRVLAGIGHVIPTEDATGKLLAMTLREVWHMAERRYVCAPQSMLASLLHLIDASINNLIDNEGDHRSEMDDRFRCLRALIAERCTDSHLSIDQLARSLAMSRSSMYEMARSAGTTIERMVIDARVKKAMAILGDLSLSQVSITALAYDLGFKHPSHLSRVFAAVAGVSPLEFRRNAREARGGRNAFAH